MKMWVLIPLILMAVCASAEKMVSTAGAKVGKANLEKSGAEKAKSGLSKLERAYQKEYTFLLSQKRVLKQQYAELKQNKSSQVAELKREIAALEKAWVKVSIDSKYVQNKLSIVERNIDSLGYDAERIDTTLKQALHRLKEYDSTLKAADKQEEKYNAVKSVLVRAPQILAGLAKPISRKGQFFDASGKEHSGQIVKFGNISAFAMSSQKQGPLAAVKGGSFKLIEEYEGDLSQQLKKSGGSIPFFLVESLSSEFVRSKGKTWADELRAGGAIGYVILGLGIVAMILVGMRILLLRQADANPEGIVTKIIDELKEDRLSQATKLCHGGKSAVERVLFDAVSNLHKDRKAVEEVINESLLREGRLLNRFATIVLITAAVAPLLGLLGTVTGMIATFDVITEFGTGDPKMLSGGVSEALVTTKFGLIVAIPAVVVGNLLSGWSKRIRSQVEQSALSVVNAVKG